MKEQTIKFNTKSNKYKLWLMLKKDYECYPRVSKLIMNKACLPLRLYGHATEEFEKNGETYLRVRADGGKCWHWRKKYVRYE